VVKAQLEGLSFSIPICATTNVFHICTYVDYINRNTLFSSNCMWQIFTLISMGIFIIYVNGLC
jgi:hypothetical protein